MNELTFVDRILEKLDLIKNLLFKKNRSYGDSALDPLGIFGKGNAETLIRARIDDKLSRIKRGNMTIESEQETVVDLIGYLILLLVETDKPVQTEKPESCSCGIPHGDITGSTIPYA